MVDETLALHTLLCAPLPPSRVLYMTFYLGGELIIMVEVDSGEFQHQFTGNCD